MGIVAEEIEVVVLMSAEKWITEVYPGSVVVSYDGWSDLDLDTPITREEFIRRAAISNIELIGQVSGDSAS